MAERSENTWTRVFTTEHGENIQSGAPSSLAKLVNITPIKPMVYGRYDYIVHGGYKPTDITAGHHPVGWCPSSESRSVVEHKSNFTRVD